MTQSDSYMWNCNKSKIYWIYIICQWSKAWFESDSEWRTMMQSTPSSSNYWTANKIIILSLSSCGSVNSYVNMSMLPSCKLIVLALIMRFLLWSLFQSDTTLAMCCPFRKVEFFICLSVHPQPSYLSSSVRFGIRFHAF